MPMDKSKYPADWKAIRAAILERAGYVCEWCGVPNHAFIHRTPQLAKGWRELDAMQAEAAVLDGERVTRIVLTIAHVGEPAESGNHTPENLAALCQRCHLNHDRDHHLKNAAATRRRKKLQQGQEAFL